MLSIILQHVLTQLLLWIYDRGMYMCATATVLNLFALCCLYQKLRISVYVSHFKVVISTTFFGKLAMT